MDNCSDGGSDFDLWQLPEVKGPATLVAGVDEVGRGALFGPVVAAAVVLPAAAISQLGELGVKDSKQLSPKRREEFSCLIQELALACQVGYGTVAEIEQVNILQASLLAMRRAILKLPVKPAICLVDGRQVIPQLEVPQYNLVKGDLRSPLIAAASVVAKVWRDALIVRFARKYPQYDLARNKGYGTQRHCLALDQYGPSSQHRLSFRPCRVTFKVGQGKDSEEC